MDFTRQPIIETVITPKEGCKLVVRSSKSTGQEEYFVDALEVVSFGNSIFFRSIERPKAFIVPASDYEVLEVREARMVLKNVGVERSIKIGGGREAAPPKPPKEPKEPRESREPREEKAEIPVPAIAAEAVDAEGRPRRDKRRQTRRRRGRDEEGAAAPETAAAEAAAMPISGEPAAISPETETKLVIAPGAAYSGSQLLTPPPTLISETIARYKDNAMFRGAFYMKEAAEGEEPVPGAEPTEEQAAMHQAHPEDILEALAMQNVSLEPPAYSTFGIVEEEETIERGVPILPEEPEAGSEPEQYKPED